MSDFYQSPADKLRFEILLKSLREGRLNLAILGDDEIALAHYGRRIFQHLREQGEAHVELWTSADSDRLVDRFNEILSTLTLDQALDKSNKATPKRFMIFPDTQGIQDFELQLLARLVNGFPASNITVILLVNSQSAYDKKLSAFGKNLLQWVLESKDPAPSKPQRLETLGDWPGAQQVPSDKKDDKKDDKRPSPPPLPPVPAPPLDLDDVRPGSTEEQSPREPVMGEPVDPLQALPTGEELAKSWEADSQPSRRSGQFAAFLLLSLLLSLGISGFVYKDRLQQEWLNLQGYLHGIKPQPAEPPKPPAPPPAPPATVSMSSSTTPPVKPAEALSPGKEELVTPSSADKASVTPVAVDAAKPGEALKPAADNTKPPEPAKPAETAKPAIKPPPEPVKPVPAPAKPEPPAPAPAPPKPEPPKPVAALPKPEPAKPPPKASDKPVDKATQPDSTSWVESLDPNAWVMQHGAFDSLSEARTFQSSALGYKAGQVLFTQRKGSKPYYILITGPYAEKAQAEALMKQIPPLAKAWLRSVKSLKAQFQE